MGLWAVSVIAGAMGCTPTPSLSGAMGREFTGPSLITALSVLKRLPCITIVIIIIIIIIREIVIYKEQRQITAFMSTKSLIKISKYLFVGIMFNATTE